MKTYRRHAKGDKTNAEIAELAVFLYGLASAALSQVSEQKPKNRVRQMQWIEQMVKALIKNFETKVEAHPTTTGRSSRSVANRLT